MLASRAHDPVSSHMATTTDDTSRNALEPYEPGDLSLPRTPPSLVRALRGSIGIGLTWGGLWAGLGAASAMIKSLTFGLPLQFILWEASSWGVVGVLSGVCFAGVLALLQRSKVLSELDSTRVALQVGGAAFVIWLGFFLLTGLLPLLGVPMSVLRAFEAALFAGVASWGTVEVVQRAGGERVEDSAE